MKKKKIRNGIRDTLENRGKMRASSGREEKVKMNQVVGRHFAMSRTGEVSWSVA